MMKKNILFCYQSLAGYVFSSMKIFIELFPDYIIHVVSYANSTDNPYIFKPVKGIVFYNREDLDYGNLLRLCHELEPLAIIVSGHIDKTYLRITNKYKTQKIPTIFLLDNYWKGTFRQCVGLLFYKLVICKIFSRIWVPGTRQYSYASLIGYQHQNITTGFYAADTASFSNAYMQSKNQKLINYPKTLVFVGRLVEYKWILELINSFLELKNEGLINNWRLLVIGNGHLKNSLPNDSNIEYREFLQPKDLPKIIEQCGAFCLPSNHENYGVVIQEFAASGLPILCSDSIGASTDFVIDNYNGYIFKTGKQTDLKSKLQKLFFEDDKKLIEMGERSFQLSKKYSQEQWAQHLYNLTTPE